MPWKGISDPYKIWLSEIILQQTRVEQGEKFYLAFTTAFPTIHHLANAAESRVLRLWQGLGYYNRCRNMMATAKEIAFDRKGVFPATYRDLLSLKGVGEYSAAAIASFAYNLPHAVVDGNVIRVLSRVFAMEIPAFDAKGKKAFREKAEELLDRTQPGRYNQAIMDLGATICKPRQPACEICPVQSVCLAFKSGQQSEYPARKTKAPLRQRTFHFFVLESPGGMLIQKRSGRDIWQDLHCFYLIESERISRKHLPEWLSIGDIGKPETFTQVLTHQKITGHFYRIPMSKAALPELPGLVWVNKKDLVKLAFPKMIISFLEKYHYL